MDLQYSFVVITLLTFLMVWLANIFKHKFIKVHKLPPGPWKLPLIGNLHQLARGSSLPHYALRDLANKYGPLMHLQLGEVSAIVISSPDMAKEILKTHDLAFAHRPRLLTPTIMMYDSTDISFAPYGELWRQMKKICTLELLSAKRVQSFSFIRQDEVAKLISTIQFSAGSLVNLSALFSSLTNTIVSRAAFGKRTTHEDEIIALVNQTLEMASGFDLADLFPSLKPIHFITGMKTKLENMHKKLDKILDIIINEHQVKMRSNHNKNEEGQENLLDVLLRVQQSGGLDIPVTVNNIKAVLWDMFLAGIDTSSTTLVWAVCELMKNPRVRENAQDEIREAFKEKKSVSETDLNKLTYLQSVIKETLRLHPPLPTLILREYREPCKIGGYEIPIKTQVIVNAWTLGRDPKYWPEEERFIPERFQDTSYDFKGNNLEYIPFGAGRRMCPGILFGLANVELPLAALLYHFDWKLPQGMESVDFDMTEAFGIVVKRKNDLYLIPTPYNDSHHDNVIV